MGIGMEAELTRYTTHDTDGGIGGGGHIAVGTFKHVVAGGANSSSSGAGQRELACRWADNNDSAALGHDVANLVEHKLVAVKGGGVGHSTIGQLVVVSGAVERGPMTPVGSMSRDGGGTEIAKVDESEVVEDGPVATLALRLADTDAQRGGTRQGELEIVLVETVGEVGRGSRPRRRPLSQGTCR